MVDSFANLLKEQGKLLGAHLAAADGFLILAGAQLVAGSSFAGCQSTPAPPAQVAKQLFRHAVNSSASGVASCRDR